MVANDVERAFHLPSEVNGDFIRNFYGGTKSNSCSEKTIFNQQQQNINQSTSPSPPPAISETSSGNVLE